MVSIKKAIREKREKKVYREKALTRYRAVLSAKSLIFIIMLNILMNDFKKSCNALVEMYIAISAQKSSRFSAYRGDSNENCTIKNSSKAGRI